LDAYLTGEILRALTEGNIGKFAAYGLVFIFLWIEVRGMKKQLILLNKNIADKFQEGEHRFEQIERELKEIRTHIVF
jgi:hypothetical protein